MRRDADEDIGVSAAERETYSAAGLASMPMLLSRAGRQYFHALIYWQATASGLLRIGDSVAQAATLPQYHANDSELRLVCREHTYWRTSDCATASRRHERRISDDVIYHRPETSETIDGRFITTMRAMPSIQPAIYGPRARRRQRPMSPHMMAKSPRL